jgi:GrpB-like predicted nucleotidyltransferase (UPF0157 family)
MGHAVGEDRRMIVVVDYDPEWPRVFETLRAPIWNTLADLAISIEHVGSTAVPGLAAKPVVDIDVVVPPEHVAAAIARLATLGYEHKGDLGIPGREALRHPPGSPRHHLYVCPAGNLALANHLAIRDALRADPAAAQAYGDLKKRLAVAYADDVDGYVAAKTGFLLDLLRRAGFVGPDLADIERLNQPRR